MNSFSSSESKGRTQISGLLKYLRPQFIMDQLTNKYALRWTVFILLILIYYLRVFVLKKGFYFITYFWAISEIALIVRFFTPDDPIDKDFTGELILPGAAADTPAASQSGSDEYRPFISQLPEFKFWKKSMAGILTVHFLVFFPIFDIPVIPFILVIYFVCFTIIALQAPIKQIIRTKRLPFDFSSIKQKHAEAYAHSS
ncbi:putative retrieval of early ER protein Rer1 [Monocercomonoides exilis]|uniref:putative retrieval of early ER protein Rer1 n=1 Tax=Monocercomonoides exilis TaxID=2049356 RepID=UPI003559CB64|nr:putative retrieval of early ER protein Rer1 [Monocercomonoides exilis]|eukprot:MONOS_10424.1-p1 / transcript=MONOS_10424.1 / gene=MONOS_10424 / organism=Monocercomonoides_exilis_PA203 / gene_product=retrieval of early ER protein Rer1 / transcript_product=retrieval of early ER protein Rer1 / location=Mono_scaffold00474:10807-11653(-) / protein_length=198 / sequence_SO=supercontig / SO=protein_coding / is_pseudo=false